MPSHVRRYVMQRINTHIFTDVPSLMRNIARVTAHLRGRSLTLVPTRERDDFYVDDDGQYWRAYEFIEGARRSRSANAHDIYLVAKAFGEFTRALTDLPGEPLHETISGFHDTKRRFAAFASALERDDHNRASSVAELVDLAVANESIARELSAIHERAGACKRVVHNDTKTNNVMLCDSGAAYVIDLDTVMMGYPLDDVGDLMRTGAATSSEDETNLTLVGVRSDYVDAVTRGYSDGIGDLLSDAERAHFLTAAKALSYETALRFLTDYLEGDHYFRIHHPGHNAERARNQFAMVCAFARLEGC
jgi:aminoglycoside phosphotransferase (APT) family kinase protein